MCGVGGVREGVGIVAEEVAEVEGVGDGLGDVNGSGLGNVSSLELLLIFHSLFCPPCSWKRELLRTVELAWSPPALRPLRNWTLLFRYSLWETGCVRSVCGKLFVQYIFFINRNK